MNNIKSLEQKLFTPETKGKSRALVVGGGGMRGAFFAGFLSTFGRELGPNFFDAIYAVSVGTYEVTFYSSNQPDTIENTWREHVDGTKLVNPYNTLIGRPILKLEYLTSIFRNCVSRLDTEAVLANTIPTYTLTDLETGKPEYKTPSNSDEIFSFMEASSALPVRKPTRINGNTYVDGTLSVGGFPIEKALQDNHDEILVLSSRPDGFYNTRAFNFLFTSLAVKSLLKGQRKVSKLCLTYGDKLKKSSRLARENQAKVEIIEPNEEILLSTLDCNKKRLNATVDLGSKSAINWLSEHGY